MLPQALTEAVSGEQAGRKALVASQRHGRWRARETAGREQH